MDNRENNKSPRKIDKKIEDFYEKIEKKEPIEIIRRKVNEINSIENLIEFKANNEEKFATIISGISLNVKYIKDSEEYNEMTKMLTSVGEKHPQLYNWCKKLIEKSINNNTKKTKEDYLQKIIEDTDAKLEKLIEEEKNIVNPENAANTLKEVANKINSIENLTEFQRNNNKEFSNLLLTISSWFNYLKNKSNDYSKYEELVMSIGEKHPQLYNWCKNLVDNEEYFEISFENDNFFDKLSIREIKNKLRREALVFKTGGIKPTNELHESWIGKVCWKLPDETQPEDGNGNKLIPIATIFLDEISCLPKALSGIKLINIFMDGNIWNNLEKIELSNWFKINTYESLDNLIPCNYVSDKLKSFPLIAKLIKNDFPMREDIDDEMFELIEKIETEKDIDYDDDIFEENYSNHKIGGYPSSIQGGVGFDEGYEYVFQIVSDEKANLNIVDSGNFYFGYNPTTKKWSIRCDFY